MHFSNPFTNPPRLPSPAKRRTHSRSPSHSPVRYRARDHDPLLRDLSPTSTLRAFVSDPNEWTESTSDALARSILTSSHSERALGAKAAQICLDVRSWTREMEHWQWPGTFELPEPARRKTRTSTLSFGTIASITPDEEEDYWGSLPARLVQTYGARADEIGQALDKIDVEELKDYVLSSHYRTGSRPAERGRRADLKQLDDYTAVITATILQTLPYLSRLNRLLDLWTTRLIILQGATSFVRDLRRAHMDMDHGWAAIAVSSASTTNLASASFSKQTMFEMKDLIEHQVASLGRRLDRFLDDLEGREETVPDAWIDDFERLETAYGHWVVQAERRVLENEWRDIQEKTTMTRTDDSDTNGTAGHADHGVSLTENPESDSEAVVRPLPVEPNDIGNDSSADAVMPRQSLSDDRKARNVPVVMAPDTVLTQDPKHSSSDLDIPILFEESLDPNGPAPLPKSRSAFLNTIERSSTLKQSKSPVRSFEHASNAFTRLFKKDRSPEQAKPGAAQAESSKPSSSSSSRSEPKLPLLRRKSRSPGPKKTRNRSVTTGSEDPLPPLPSQPFDVPQGKLDSQSQAESSFRFIERPPAPILMPPEDVRRHRISPVMDVQEDYDAVPLSSPFHSPKKGDFPEEWPLSSPVETPHEEVHVDPMAFATTKASEIYTPTLPLQTDMFDQMFVQSLPVAKSSRPGSARETRERASWAEGHKRAKSLPRMKNHRPATGAPQLPQITQPHNIAVGSQRSPVRIDPSRSVVSRPISMVAEEAMPSPPDSDDLSPGRTTVYLGDKSSATEPSSQPSPPDPVQTENSIPEDVDASAEYELHNGAERSGNEEPNNDGDIINDDSASEKPTLLKRASITSVEAFKRADVKSIDVQAAYKPTDPSPVVSPPRTPSASRPQSPALQLAEKSPSTPFNYDGQMMFPTPPRNSSIGKGSVSATPETPTSLHRDTQQPSSPSSSQPDRMSAGTPERRRAPLNAAMTKRRGKAPQRGENLTPGVLTLSPSKKGSVFNPEGDSFDRHISEVLEGLPSSIRFRTRPGAGTPVPGASEPRISGPPRAKTSRVGPRHNVTIAPADSPPKRSNTTSDNEVKVYHLTQAGSDETIKLFVRLVGESERVMVRVGGGWADLADYLRQYAEHHGSRTVSESTLEVQTVNGTASRRVSGAAELKGTAQPVTPNNNNRAPGNENPSWLDEPQPRFSIGDSTSSDEAAPIVKTRQPTSATNTPLSAASRRSRSSTINTERPSSRQSVSDVKLSGPSSGKRGQLSEHKEKWVEGMIEKAKQASTEKSKDETQKYFGELGKAGGTRRVIFRSSSAMSNRPNGGDKAK